MRRAASVWACRWPGFSDRRGSSAVQFAVVAPVFFLLVLGTMEYARLVWTQSTVQAAVQEGARCAGIGVCADAAAVQTVVKARMFAIPTAGMSIAYQPSDAVCPATAGYLVTATLPFTFLVPAMFPTNLTLGGRACYPL